MEPAFPNSCTIKSLHVFATFREHPTSMSGALWGSGARPPHTDNVPHGTSQPGVRHTDGTCRHPQSPPPAMHTAFLVSEGSFYLKRRLAVVVLQLLISASKQQHSCAAVLHGEKKKSVGKSVV